MQSRPTEMEIGDRAPIGEISADGKRIFRLDSDIEFPVAHGGLGNRKIGPIFYRLRRGPSRQTDRNQINILEKMTVRKRNIAFDRRAGDWSSGFQIGIGACRQGIVSCDQNTVRSQIEIEIRFGQLGENNAPSHGKRTAGEIPMKSFQGQGVIMKKET